MRIPPWRRGSRCSSILLPFLLLMALFLFSDTLRLRKARRLSKKQLTRRSSDEHQRTSSASSFPSHSPPPPSLSPPPPTGRPSRSAQSSLSRRFTFSCVNRPVGYYADTTLDCRVFHICDNFGRRVPIACPPLTRFNQIVRVCDWADNVDCSEAPAWYYVNGVQPANATI